MIESIPPREASPPSGHEQRDMNNAAIFLIVVVFAITVVFLLVVLWMVSRSTVPESDQEGVSPPVRRQGERPVEERLHETRSPRIEGLGSQPDVHPEDLRAERQPQLQGYSWVDRSKGIARIPIDRAMDAVVESSGKQAGKKGGGP
jgi:hypothetical protein